MEVEVLTFDTPIYHIYIKNRCLYNCLKEEEFDIKWAELNAMVGLMKTDYTVEDLSYTKVEPEVGVGGGGAGSVHWNDPPGDPSY